MTLELDPPFDAAEYITDPEAQAELLSDALASGDRAYIAKALGTVARARGGLSKLAAETGLQRQALHRALSVDGNPRLHTILKVVAALGFHLAAREAA
jgi:probable addiction module antidote protein